MGALSVTWDEHYRGPFQPLIPGVSFADADDRAASTRSWTTTTAAIIVEPIQGEGGVRPIPAATSRRSSGGMRDDGRAAHRRRSAERLGPHGTVPRTADARASRRISSRSARRSAPACRSASRCSRTQSRGGDHPGDHGTTYGGNLLACRAALVVPRRARPPASGASIAASSAHLFAGLREMQAAASGHRRDVRGARTDRGPRLARRCRAGRGGRARTRPAHQPHVEHGRPPAAAVHHHRAGHRRSDGDSG